MQVVTLRYNAIGLVKIREPSWQIGMLSKYKTKKIRHTLYSSRKSESFAGEATREACMNLHDTHENNVSKLTTNNYNRKELF